MKRSRLYTQLVACTRWRKLRLEYLKAHPFCERCSEVGLTTSATEVHHITPIESAVGIEAMSRLAYDPDNLQALCHACHVAVHTACKSKSRLANQEREQNKIKSFKDKYL